MENNINDTSNTEKTLDRFGKRLYSKRTAKELTQSELSKMTGIAAESISRYENSQRVPSIKDAFLLSRVLGCTLDWLAYGGEE